MISLGQDRLTTHCRRVAVTAGGAMASMVLVAAGATVGHAAPLNQGSGCPGLMVYAIQGTGQSSPDADPSGRSPITGPGSSRASSLL